MTGFQTPNMFTVYHALEKKGAFNQPANASSRGPNGETIYERAEYPKMFYHPKGETRITKPAEIVVTPMGPKEVGEQRELVSKVARNEDEELVLLKEGWHDHPAKAIAAGGGKAPPISPAGKIQSLESEIDRLKRELAKAQAVEPSPVRTKADLAALK